MGEDTAVAYLVNGGHVPVDRADDVGIRSGNRFYPWAAVAYVEYSE